MKKLFVVAPYHGELEYHLRHSSLFVGNGENMLTAMSGIGWVDKSNRVYTHYYTGYRGF